MNRKINITTKSLFIILGIISLSVFTLTIAYAALSTNLNISGSANVPSSTWNIFIDNAPEGYTNTATGSASFTQPTITGTKIANYSVTLVKPGDSVTLYFKLWNEGTLNGEFNSITNSTPKCTSSTGNTADESLICDNLNISLTYEESSIPIAFGDTLNTNGQICKSNTTSANINGIIKLEISLNSSMTSVPGSEITIYNLNHEFVITQTDNICKYSGSIGEK